MRKPRFPEGRDEGRVAELIAHCEGQSEEEAVLSHFDISSGASGPYPRALSASARVCGSQTGTLPKRWWRRTRRRCPSRVGRCGRSRPISFRRFET